MFVSFFYTLKESGIPISPTSFLRLHKALKLGLVTGLDDFYTAARCILVKSERYFDLYDRGLLLTYFMGRNCLILPALIWTPRPRNCCRNG